jgi:hypothetical protein
MTPYKGSITRKQTLENNIVILKTHQFVGGRKEEGGRGEYSMLNWLAYLTERRRRERINLPKKLI